MKISCIILNSNSINIGTQRKMVDFLNTKLYEIGENISLISYFDNSLENLKNASILNTDFVFVIGKNSSIYNNNIKENLCRIFGDKLETNDACVTALKKYCDTSNIPFSSDFEMDASIPTKAIPLCDENYDSTGFMYKQGNTYIVYLPENIPLLTFSYPKYIAPLIGDITQPNGEFVALKCFGILEKDIKVLIESEFSNPKISIQIRSDGLDSAIFIRYSSDTPKVDVQDTVSNICNKLNKYIYATEDVSLYDMALELLSIRGKKIILGETLTYGNIARKLSENGANRITDSFVFTNIESMLKYTKVSPKVIENYGMYSVNTVYEVANSMLEMTSADTVLFVLGNQNKSDLCYMAIGDVDGIHVYKNKINVKGEDLIKNLSDTAIFYLIKKLKRNDLQM